MLISYLPFLINKINSHIKRDARKLRHVLVFNILDLFLLFTFSCEHKEMKERDSVSHLICCVLPVARYAGPETLRYKKEGEEIRHRKSFLPSACMSDVHKVRLSRSNCIISVESL